jgi:mono/diheme cytochrome c family protein
VLAALALFIVVRTGAISANADQRVPRIERWAAKTSLRASLQRSGSAAIANPLPATNENLLAGIKLYAQDCAICHGAAAATGAT